MSEQWLQHDNDRIWTVVLIGSSTESDAYGGHFELDEATRIVRTLLPLLADDEIRETLTEITAALDIAHRASFDPVGTLKDLWDGALPMYPQEAARDLADRKRAEAFTSAELAVSVNDARHEDQAVAVGHPHVIQGVTF